MPRKTKKTVSLAEKPQVFPTAIYTRTELAEITGYCRATIIRAEKDRKLKKQPGPGDSRYLGVHILEWMGWPKGVPVPAGAEADGPRTQTCTECPAAKLVRVLEQLLVQIKNGEVQV